jgi:Amt family ammonium transporter
MTIIFQVIKHTIGLRVSAEEELAGLDSKEHGLTSAYDGFMVQDALGNVPAPMGTSRKAPAASPVHSGPVETVPEIPAEGVHKLTKVVIITRQNKLDEFMQAMNEIGVTGITITNVLGCGVQKGAKSYYRGVEMDMNLLPKVKIEIVVSLVPVQKVVETAKAVLHTGQIGDGKVFVYDIENVIKIRTGEEGYMALQDSAE